MRLYLIEASHGDANLGRDRTMERGHHTARRGLLGRPRAPCIFVVIFYDCDLGAYRAIDHTQ